MIIESNDVRGRFKIGYSKRLELLFFNLGENRTGLYGILGKLLVQLNGIGSCIGLIASHFLLD